MKRNVALAAAMLLQSGSSSAAPDEVVSLEDLLPKLAMSAERFESALKKASYTVEGHMESVARDGTTSDRREGKALVRGDGKRSHVDVLRYTEDGVDKTTEAREKAAESARKDPEDDEAHMPFLTSEQPRYVFQLREKDLLDRKRVRVEFAPREPSKLRVVGSAWVDVRTGDVLSMGVTPSKTGPFVDYLRVTLEFDEKMGDGPGVSKISVEGSGGFLFFHRRFRGVAHFSNYSVPRRSTN